MGLTLFNIFINDLDNALSKSADDTKLGVVVDTPGRCATIQRDAEKPEKWADKNLLKKFNKEKCKVLNLGKNNPMHQRGAGD